MLNYIDSVTTAVIAIFSYIFQHLLCPTIKISDNTNAQPIETEAYIHVYLNNGNLNYHSYTWTYEICVAMVTYFQRHRNRWHHHCLVAMGDTF